MPIDWEKILSRMDELIRSGKGALVVDELGRYYKERIPRKFISKLANVSYRVEVPGFGLRILNPIVRNEKKGTDQASPEEKAEYAYGLIRVGALEEGLEVLRKLDPVAYQRTGYYQACGHVGRWEYKESIPYFEKYIQTLSPTEYPRIVAETNLAAAYVYENEFEKALSLLHEVRRKAEKAKLNLLFGKALQLTAEVLLQNSKWEEFEEAFEETTKHLRLSAGLDGFFLKKLLFQKELMTNPQISTDSYAKIRNEAVQSSHYESVRDCDRLYAIYTKDPEVFCRVYFGSPMEAYRKRLLKEFNPDFAVPPQWKWNVTGKKGRKELDLEASRFGNGSVAFDLGSLPHRLLVALCKDFYRPTRIATLYQSLYPGEYYNPISSPLKTHRALKRLRDWIDADDLGLVVDESNEFYSLTANEPLSILVPNPDQNLGTIPEPIFRLMKLFPDSEFSVSEGAKALDMATRTLSRHLKKCLEDGKIVKVGSGAAAKYVFPKEQKRAA